MKRKVVIVSKAPSLAKKRLAKQIGRDEATRVYAAIFKKIISELSDYNPLVFIKPWEKKEEFNDLCNGCEMHPQIGDDLGEIMLNSFNKAKDDEDDMVALMGGDILNFKKEIIDDAFILLESVDIVVGPSEDGRSMLMSNSSRYDYWSIE